MGRASAAKKKLKVSKSMGMLDLEEGRSVRPTEEVFDRMKVYKSFVVTNKDDKTFRFERGQVVLILPHGFDPKKAHDFPTYWAARIRDIRGQEFVDGSNIVWVRVQWFYSGKDVSDVIKSFDCNAVGNFERIYSDHVDFVQPDSFETVIPMYKLNEVDPEQNYIPENSFYRRYTFEFRARNLQPKPGLMTCVCRTPYNPNDVDPESLMHFCPRPSCRKAFHHRCLVGLKSKEGGLASKSPFSLTIKMPDFSNGSEEGDTVEVSRSARKHAAPLKKRLPRKAKVVNEIEDEAEVASIVIPKPTPSSKTRSGQQKLPSSLSGRSLRLLGCSADVDENVDLQDLVYSNNRMEVDSDTARISEDDESTEEIVMLRRGRRGRPPTKRSKGKAAHPGTENPTLDSVLETIPSELVTIATQPLVRGGAFPAGGVAGNIGMVTRARKLVYTALQMGGGQNAVGDWEDIVFGEDREVVGIGLENAVVRVTFPEGRMAKKDQGLPPFLCPNCQSAI